MSHNVLVVDDEPKLCDLLSSALTQNDVHVFTAGNGLQALALLEQEDIDLVISDWRMPGMDGPQLLAEVKLRYPQLPVIVMTAYSTVKNAVQSMRNGAYDYIAKPFDIDELDITVSKALQFRDIVRDNARMRAELDEHQHIDSLVVLEHGRVVEQGPVWQVFGNPQHEVSKTLLAPLQHGLPDELHSRLQAKPATLDAAIVLRLQFTGSDTDEPDLAALFSALGGRVRLLQGGVERIQGHALGQLLLAVNGSPHNAEELRNRAGNWAQQVEVLGYVV